MSERTSFEAFVRELERDEDFKVLLDEARRWFEDDGGLGTGAGVPRRPSPRDSAPRVDEK